MFELIVRLAITAYALPPVPASRVAARIFDVPEAELVYIARRESSGRRIGVHPDDAANSAIAWRKAVDVGWLRPHRCAFHAYAPGEWFSRGGHGLAAAYNLRYLGAACLPPWILDVPIVSAFAAANKWQAICADGSNDGPGEGWCGF